VELVARYESLSILEARGCRLHAVKWVLVDQLSPSHREEE
jgi:hypothetical protein